MCVYIGGYKGGGQGRASPLQSKFFHFHAVSAIILQNNRFEYPLGSWRPLWEILNPPLACALDKDWCAKICICIGGMDCLSQPGAPGLSINWTFLLEDVSSEFIGLSVAFGFHSIEPTRVSTTPIDISTPQSLFLFFLFKIKGT